jgi:polyisoprenoid-binding protein YceI
MTERTDSMRGFVKQDNPLPIVLVLQLRPQPTLRPGVACGRRRRTCWPLAAGAARCPTPAAPVLAKWARAGALPAHGLPVTSPHDLPYRRYITPGDFRMRKFLLAAALSAMAAPALAAPTTYTIDPTHTDVIASWSHFGFSHPSAHFGDIAGSLTYDPANVAASSVAVTLPLSGLEAFTDKFNTHLNSADFFDSAKFPTASFKSTKVEAAGKDKLKVTGDLTIKGITKPVVLDVTLNKAADHPMKKTPSIGFDATAMVKRSDFGLGAYAPMVSDEVRLTITTEADAAKAK